MGMMRGNPLMKNRLPVLLLIFFLLCTASCRRTGKTTELMPYVKQQMDLGPRTPGSEAHSRFAEQTAEMLKSAGWSVSSDPEKYQGKTVRNIIADRGPEAYSSWIVIGAHYDSRITADQEKQEADRQKAVPAANDGASGAAVLMGLARTLPELPDRRVTLAFFDAEDQGRVMGLPDWCLGSRLLAEQYGSLERKPDAVIVIDMIGDADLNVYREKNSDPGLNEALFTLAKDLGLSGKFIDAEKYAMYDDHIPFLEKGIPAADLIDFDYPWWHTLEDTADKLSEESLQAVYKLLYTFITGK